MARSIPVCIVIIVTTLICRANGIIMDPLGNYVLDWHVDTEKHVVFYIVVKTNGFVAFGISKDGKVNEAEMLVAQIVDEEIQLKVYHSHGESEIDEDEQVSWDVTQASKNSSHISLSFSKTIGSIHHVIKDREDEVFFTWAYPRSGSNDLEYQFHGNEVNHGAMKVDLRKAIIGAGYIAEDKTRAFGPVVLDPFGKYIVNWELNEDIGNVTFTVVVQTSGYVGFGISNTGTKSGSDMAVMTTDVENEIVVKDYHGTTSPTPVEDVQQDWILLSSFREDGYTTLTFTRAIDTGNSAEDVVIADEDTYFLWAFPKSNSPVLTYHGPGSEGYRGAYKINILNPVFPTSPPPTTTEPSTISTITTEPGSTTPVSGQDIMCDFKDILVHPFPAPCYVEFLCNNLDESILVNNCEFINFDRRFKTSGKSNMLSSKKFRAAPITCDFQNILVHPFPAPCRVEFFCNDLDGIIHVNNCGFIDF